MDLLPPEIIVYFSNWISKVGTLRNLRDTCRYLHDLLPLKRCSEDADIAILFQKYPNASWSWEIGAHPHITKTIVDANPEFNWSVQSLYRNCNINPYDLSSPEHSKFHLMSTNINLQFVEEMLIEYPASLLSSWYIFPISLEKLKLYPKIKKKAISYICKNSYYKLTDLIALDMVINLDHYSQNKNVCKSDIELINSGVYTTVGNWDWYAISRYIELDYVRANPQISWDYGLLSTNPHLTWEFVLQNLKKDWYFPLVSETLKIEWSVIDKLITYDYTHVDDVFQRAYGIIDFIRNHPEIEGDRTDMQYNVNISFEEMFDNRDLFPSLWHRNIKWDVVVAHPEVRWSFKPIL